MRRRSLPQAVLLLACASLVPALVACKKPAPAVVDAGPEPVVIDAAPAILQPLDEDAGTDAGEPDAAKPHHAGSGMTTNQARVKECCNEMRKMVGTDPFFAPLVVQCDAIATQVGSGTGGQAPEFAPLRQMLKGKNIPAVCRGL